MSQEWNFRRHTVVGSLGLRPPAAADESGNERPAHPRYTVQTRIGAGGQGEIFLATDHDLLREVAMKVLRREHQGDLDLKLRFLAEAQTTSQLEHPGIPPVHDIDMTKDGRIYFSMKRVRGTSLREVLMGLLLKRRRLQQEYTLHRLVTILERIAETLEFAHEHGVIHRDIKPDNVMLGDYGEVHLMDWGLARVMQAADEDSIDLEYVETDRLRAANETLDGRVAGTPAWMSPEQAAGHLAMLDGRADIYGLGCILYQMLSFFPPFDEEDPHVISRVRVGDYEPVRTRNPQRRVPEALAIICERAMETSAEDRYDSPRAMAEELRQWLDGRDERQRRNAEARVLAERGKEAASRWRRTKAAVAKAEARVASEKRRLKPWQSLEDKETYFAAREQLQELRQDAFLAFQDALHLLQAALFQRGDDPTAQHAIVDLLRTHVEDAERDGDEKALAYGIDLLARHDGGRLADFIRGDGTLTIETSPAGAEVVVETLRERNGILGVTGQKELGRAPVAGLTLPMGSHVCRVSKPGYRTVVYPVRMDRNAHWEGRVRLRTEEEVGENFVYVPGGPFLMGQPGRGLRTVEVEDFAMQLFPTTFGEYAEFLRALDVEEGEGAALLRVPGTERQGPYMARGDDGVLRPVPTLVEGDARNFCLETFGAGFESRLPVVGVRFEDALAYCAWRRRVTGVPHRLPTDQEWEKASRGVDARVFPWGSLEDDTMGKCRDARPVNPQLEPVGGFPHATSVYGVGDAVGNVWNWTDSWFDAHQTSHVIRGGSWNHPLDAMRCCTRARGAGHERMYNVGFRCVRELE